jgi:LacI family transcriptional regulator
MAGKNIVTIALLAKELGLGKATISLALRDDPRIRKQTRERVQRHADKRGYAANPMVAHVMSQLRSAKVSEYRATVALINVATREDAIRSSTTFRTIADGFRKRAAELSYQVEDLWIGDEIFADPERLKKVFLTRKIEGMAFVGMSERAHLPDQVHAILSRSVFVGLGVRLTQPLVHCCANNQYNTALLAAQKMLSTGFPRVGLVKSLAVDRALDGRISMGFRRALEEAGWRDENAHAMIWRYQPNDAAGFLKWCDEAKPDVILTVHTDVAGWLKSAPGGSRKIALAHLDWNPSFEGWAGMNQHNDKVGSFGAELLTAHLARRDLGLPDAVKTMLVESEWIDGKSLRPGEFLV